MCDCCEHNQVELSGAVKGKAVWPKHLNPVAWHRDSEMVRMKLGLYHSKGNVRRADTSFSPRAIGNTTSKPTRTRTQRQNECRSRLPTVLEETCILCIVLNNVYMHHYKYRFAVNTCQHAYCLISLAVPCWDPGTQAV